MNKKGFTLIEMVVLLSIISILFGIAIYSYKTINRKYSIKQEVYKLYDDLKYIQTLAVNLGAHSVVNGKLIEKMVYVVFDEDQNSYFAYKWEDFDNDKDFDSNEIELLLSNKLKNKVTFSKLSGVNKSACYNNGTSPSKDVSFNIIDHIPCNGKSCLEMDDYGFAINNGSIYLSDGFESYAISVSKAGNFRICRWDDKLKQWQFYY
ncbi:pilus assembly FimT family protein [Deferribacter autotrophicus]|uniref:pilus assembly FimT family protein n=1 Tax=Deferribacter autotrophicus TaxID=500465 RepID=UPI00165E63A6|nr:type II secretion system protein [Deferribacter autotrophicus]